jgi:hypothetical protein
MRDALGLSSLRTVRVIIIVTVTIIVTIRILIHLQRLL